MGCRGSEAVEGESLGATRCRHSEKSMSDGMLPESPTRKLYFD